MATISTVRSGNWSDTSHITGPWPGASTPTTLPTNADAVTVIKNTVLTLDSNTAVCKTLTLAVGTTGADVGAEFTCITTGNTKLVVENNITCSGATGGSGAYSSKFNLDMSAAPSYTCEIYTNNAAGSSNYGISIAGQFQLKGAPKTRWTTLTAAMSATNATATVADATGWRPGDKVVFAPTDSGSTWTTRKWDDKVLDGTYVADSESLVLTSGVTYGHANTSPVGNFTSNLVLGPAAAGNWFTLAISSPGTQMTANAYITDVEFRAARRDSAFQAAMLQLSGAASKIVAVSNNAFYDYRGRAFTPNNMVVPYTRDRNIFFASTTSGESAVGGDTSASSLPVYIGEDTNYVVFAMSGNNASAITAFSPSQHQRGHRICGCWDQYGSNPAVGIEVTNPETEVSDCLIWHCI